MAIVTLVGWGKLCQSWRKFRQIFDKKSDFFDQNLNFDLSGQTSAGNYFQLWTVDASKSVLGNVPQVRVAPVPDQLLEFQSEIFHGFCPNNVRPLESHMVQRSTHRIPVGPCRSCKNTNRYKMIFFIQFFQYCIFNIFNTNFRIKFRIFFWYSLYNFVPKISKF